jgi:hypothetical protein
MTDIIAVAGTMAGTLLGGGMSVTAQRTALSRHERRADYVRELEACVAFTDDLGRAVRILEEIGRHISDWPTGRRREDDEYKATFAAVARHVERCELAIPSLDQTASRAQSCAWRLGEEVRAGHGKGSDQYDRVLRDYVDARSSFIAGSQNYLGKVKEIRRVGGPTRVEFSLRRRATAVGRAPCDPRLPTDLLAAGPAVRRAAISATRAFCSEDLRGCIDAGS